MISSMDTLLDLTADLRRELSACVILEAMIGHHRKALEMVLPKAFLDLQPVLDEMEDAGLLEYRDGLLQVTLTASTFFQDHLDRIASLRAHFNIYAHVDLERGLFAYTSPQQALACTGESNIAVFLEQEGYDSFEDYLGDLDRWDDCRAVVSEFKNLCPFLILFYDHFQDPGTLFRAGWPKRVAWGVIFDLLIDKVSSGPSMEWFDHGQTDVSNLILKGARENKERLGTHPMSMPPVPPPYRAYHYQKFLENYRDPDFTEPCWQTIVS